MKAKKEQTTEFHGKGPEDYRQAEWLAQRLRKEWRYDYSTDTWHHFDGVRWAPNKQKGIHKAIAKTAARALETATGEGEQKRLFSLLQWPAQERAMKALATLDGYGTTGAEWDQDPYLLGCTNGVLDLRTGELREGKPEDLVTKSTGVAYDENAECPTFLQFLWDVTADADGNERADVSAYVLHMFGAALFGMTLAQQFWLLSGPPNAGKGALCRTIAYAFGVEDDGYAHEADSSLYTKGRFGPTSSQVPRADLVALKGRRLVYVHEPNSPFEDNMLKKHSGGDRITARALHSNVVLTWEPTHSIVFSTNSLPRIEDVGAQRRRARVVTFLRDFEDSQDVTLEPRMQKEAAGILALLVKAAREVYADPGILTDPSRLPPAIADESRAYMEDNDPLASWVKERVILQSNRPGRVPRTGLKVRLSEAHTDFVTWLDKPANRDMTTMGVKAFKAAVVKLKGVTTTNPQGAVMLHGMGLVSTTPEEGPEGVE